jgi:hypothetical protein
MAAGGAAAAIAQAIKASGVVIRVAPYEFRKIIIRMPDPLVVIAQGGGLFDEVPIPDKLQGLGVLHEIGHSARSPCCRRCGHGGTDLGTGVAGGGGHRR